MPRTKLPPITYRATIEGRLEQLEERMNKLEAVKGQTLEDLDRSLASQVRSLYEKRNHED